MRFKKWEVVLVEFGMPEDELSDFYSKDAIVNELYGVNLGKEFSKRHYGIVISPSYLNFKKVIVLPITGKREKYKCEYDNIHCLKEKYKFLSKPSVVLINDIRSVDVKRVSKFTDKNGNVKEFFIEKSDQEKIKKKLISFFMK